MNCRKCGVELRSENKAWKLIRCKPCHAKWSAEYYRTHHEEKLAYAKNYRIVNREKVLESKRDWSRQYSKEYPYECWARLTLTHHKRNGIDVQLTRSELEILARETTNCHICGAQLDWINRTRTNPSSPTLDRINNERTISKATIQIVCLRCNMAKGDMAMDEFINYCEMVAAKFAKYLEVN
jgi:hypothetical protein